MINEPRLNLLSYYNELNKVFDLLIKSRTVNGADDLKVSYLPDFKTIQMMYVILNLFTLYTY